MCRRRRRSKFRAQLKAELPYSNGAVTSPKANWSLASVATCEVVSVCCLNAMHLLFSTIEVLGFTWRRRRQRKGERRRFQEAHCVILYWGSYWIMQSSDIDPRARHRCSQGVRANKRSTGRLAIGRDDDKLTHCKGTTSTLPPTRSPSRICLLLFSSSKTSHTFNCGSNEVSVPCCDLRPDCFPLLFDGC